MYCEMVLAKLGTGELNGLADLAPSPGNQACFDPSDTPGRLEEDYRVWHQVIAKQC